MYRLSVYQVKQCPVVELGYVRPLIPELDYEMPAFCNEAGKIEVFLHEVVRKKMLMVILPAGI